MGRPPHATDADPTALTPAPARLVVLLGALTAFSPLAIDMYLPAFPEIQRDLAAPPGSLQLTLSLFLAGLATGQFVVGPLSDRTGRRPPLLAGCAAFAVASALCTLAPSVGWLMAARFLMGFAGAAGLVISRAVVRDLFDEDNSAGMFSMMMVVSGVAPVVAPTLGGAIIARFHWHAIFAVLATFGVACAAAVALSLHETLPPAARSRGRASDAARAYLRVLRHRQFLGYAAISAFGYGVLFAYISGSPFVFIDLHGLSPQRYSLLFATNAIGLFAGGRLNHWLVGRRRPVRDVLGAACLINVAAGLLLIVLASTGFGGLPAFFAVLFCAVASLGLILPNSTAAAMAPFARDAGTASALLGVAQYAVGAISGALVGLLHDGTARPMAFLIAACGALAVGVFGMLPSTRTAGPAEAPLAELPEL